MDGVVLFGVWGPAYIACARSLDRQGLAPYLLRTGGKQKSGPLSASLAGHRDFPPEEIGTEAGLRKLREYALEVNAKAIVALSEAHLCWLSKNRNTIEQIARLVTSSESTWNLIRSKIKQIELAREIGFEVLPSWFIRNEGDAESVDEKAFPIAIRPSMETGVSPHFKVKMIQNRQSMRKFICNLTYTEPLIFQPLKIMPNILVHGVRGKDGWFAPWGCFIVPRKFEGVSLSIHHTSAPTGLIDACKEFADRAEIVGPFHFDLLFDPIENRAYYLEINARFGGTTDKVFCLGYDEPALAMQSELLLPRKNIPEIISKKAAVNRKALIKHIIWSLAGRLTLLDYPPKGRFSHALMSLYDLIRGKDSVLDWSDIRGSYRCYIN